MRLSTLQALRLGWRAVRDNIWLAPVGMLTALAGTIATAPAFVLAIALGGRGAGLMLRRNPFNPQSAWMGAVLAWSSPQVIAIVMGLALSGSLIAVMLRIAFLAGALPTLGTSLSGGADNRLFATSLAYRFAHFLPGALLAGALQALGIAFAFVVAIGSVQITARAAGSGYFWLAFPVAFALTLAVIVPLLFNAMAEAAIARVALRGEGAAVAIHEGLSRVLRRPAPYLLIALVVAMLHWTLVGSMSVVGSLASGMASDAQRAAPWISMGIQLMLMVIGALIGAGAELWRLGAVAALCCGDERR